MLALELVIQDVRDRVLNYALYGSGGHNLLHGFFHFPRTERDFQNPRLLSDCHFYDISIRDPVEDPDLKISIPDPGLFEAFFPTILRRLLGSTKLTLFVKAVYRDYFNELEIVERILAPRSLGYVLLANLSGPLNSRIPVDFGNLVFEWPKDELAYVVEEWFISPTVMIEGYASDSSAVSAISRLYFEPDTEERVRELLRVNEFGFRVWRDNNGLFLVTDKLDIDVLKGRLSLEDLNLELNRIAKRDQ
jgi:hypothetical protein